MKVLVYKRLKGFTIIELLVVMVLSSVVLSFAYASLRYVQKLFIGHKEQALFTNKLINLKDRLEYDFFQSDKIVEVETGRFIIYKDTVVNELWFKENDLIYLQGETRDTFHFESLRVEVNYKYISGSISTSALVSKLNLKFTFKEEEHEIQLKKVYCSDILLKIVDSEDANY